MARKVENWNADTLTWDFSEREYDEYRVAGSYVSDYNEEQPTWLRLYIDAETGVIVRDVALYEASLKASA